MKIHKILNIETGLTENWSVEAMLYEINRDRSDSWTNYDEDDYIEGWNEWVDGEFYKLVD